MSIVKSESILGYFQDNGQIICAECATGDDSDITLDDLITEESVGSTDELYFCDICKRQLN